LDQKEKQSIFDELLLRSRGRLAAVAGAYAYGDADDLLQEILLQIWRSLSTFKGDSSIDTWCYRVALNTALTWRRSQTRRKKNIPSEASNLNELPTASDGHDPAKLLEQFLRTLSKSDRALVLLYLDDLNGKQMAEVTGLNEGAIRVRIHRIKQKLAHWKVGDQ
jgi:RNA polymerase sigma-70 factor (ECF subfamily)